MLFEKYDTHGFYDELFTKEALSNPTIQMLIDLLNSMSFEDLLRKQNAADLSFLKSGITFTLNSGSAELEKTFPFDVIPRVILANEWENLEKGLKQRITALNMFIHDIYNEQHILKDKTIPREIIESSPGYIESCKGLKVPLDIWSHISGIDLIRQTTGEFLVLEDNLRCPSGVSYVLENRNILKRIFPSVFGNFNIHSVSNYPEQLLSTLSELSTKDEPSVALLTPGVYNSAYYEHMYLAKEMGIPLVEGRDLIVEDDFLYVKTTSGLKLIDVIYRRIDDEFLDPSVFNKNSLLGVKGIMSCYTKGNVAIANAPGCGLADDKSMYPYVPSIISYYLDEKPILGQVQTYLGREKSDLKYMLDNLSNLVIKPTDQSGGYGIVIGPRASTKEIAEIRSLVKKDPEHYVGQPVISLSRAPTITETCIEGRHVDFRPYILSGESPHVLPGGLTRVALTKDSLIVNSSQGGGSKDTWVLSD